MSAPSSAQATEIDKMVQHQVLQCCCTHASRRQWHPIADTGNFNLQHRSRDYISALDQVVGRWMEAERRLATT